MPMDDEKTPQAGTGIALSGGGFRATLFHLGALWRLNEMGWLPKLDRISSVSGGSITSGLLSVRWKELRFDASGIASNFGDRVVEPLREFCERDIDAFAVAEGLFRRNRRAGDEVEERYRKHLLGGASLKDLPEKPRFVFNATNLATGRSFRFSRPYAGDYRIGLIKDPDLPVAKAVAASSAFPPFLSPVMVKVDPDRFEAVEGADLHPQRKYREAVYLTDGGVYDNMGLETVWNRYQTVLVSDAGAPFAPSPDVSTAWHSMVMRALDVSTDQSRGLRKRALIDDFIHKRRSGAYWGIGTPIAEYRLAGALPVPAGTTRELATMRTRLNSFSETEQKRLINWGYAVCDAAMRAHVTSGAGPAPGWPYEGEALGRPAQSPGAGA